jgi:DNA-binding transcriptional MerR regulator
MDQLQIFTTERVARILSLPEWRVVRFAQIKKYGITPAFGQAAGSGSRRLYDLKNVCEIALASRLTTAGLRIEVIARVLKQVRDQGGLEHLMEESASELQHFYLGVKRAPHGKITGQQAVQLRNWKQLQDIFSKNWDSSLLVVPLGALLIDVKQSLEVELENARKKS